MMTLKKTLYGTSIALVLLALATVSCNRGRFTVSGSLEGAAEGKYLVLKEVKPDILRPVDSVIPDSDGSFAFRAETAVPSFFILSSGKDNFITLLVSPGDRISIRAGALSLGEPQSLEGSPATELMITFRKRQKELLKELEELNKVYNDSLESPHLPLIIDSLDREATSVVSAFRDSARIILDENAGSMVSLFLLNQQVVPGMQLFDARKNPELFIRADSVLYQKYPTSDLVIDLHSFVAGLRRSMAVGGEEESVIAPGADFPEIALPGLNGDTIRLSTTKGKVVLVDFWASWCPPCRQENPELVKLYDMYRSRGFDIFQVSLDLRKEDWVQAVRDDRLGRWKHVSDLKYKDSEMVQLLGLTEIPASFLLDRDGRVIAVNLRGEALAKKLEELFDAQ